MSEHTPTIEVADSSTLVISCTCGWGQPVDAGNLVTKIFEASFNHVMSAALMDVANVFIDSASKVQAQAPVLVGNGYGDKDAYWAKHQGAVLEQGLES